MAVKSRDAIKLLFSDGILNQGDLIDIADSFFNTVDDRVNGSLILDGSIGINELTASTLNILSTTDGLVAWNVNTNGDLLPFTSNFQNIGSASSIVNNFFLNDLTVYNSTSLPINTTIGSVTSTEISYLQGVTSPIQNQIDNIQTSGGGGAVGYTHIQTTASDTWTVVHNKNTKQLVYLLLDNNDNQILPDTFKLIDLNTVEITFAFPIVGQVNLIFY